MNKAIPMTAAECEEFSRLPITAWSKTQGPVIREFFHGIAIAHAFGIYFYFSEDESEAELEPAYTRECSIGDQQLALWVLDGIPYNSTEAQLYQKGFVAL